MPKYTEHITIDGVRYEARLTAKRIVVTNGRTTSKWTSKRGRIERSVEGYWTTDPDDIYDDFGRLEEGYISLSARYFTGLPGKLRLRDAENASPAVAERIREVFRIRAEDIQKRKLEGQARRERQRRAGIERARNYKLSSLASRMGDAAKVANYDRVLEVAREYNKLANTPIDYGEQS